LGDKHLLFQLVAALSAEAGTRHDQDLSVMKKAIQASTG
jgi:hypothetical protein